jgi:hypothetical protein
MINRLLPALRAVGLDGAMLRWFGKYAAATTTS